MPQVFCFAFEVLENSKNLKEVINFIRERKAKKDNIVFFSNTELAGRCAKFILDHDLKEFVQPIVSSSFISIERGLKKSCSDEELILIDSDLGRCNKASSRCKVFYVEKGIDYLSDLQKMTELTEASAEWAKIDAKKAGAGFREEDVSSTEELKKLYEGLSSKIKTAIDRRDGSFDDAVEVPDLSAWGGAAAAGGCGAPPSKLTSHLAKGLFGGGGARSSGSTLREEAALSLRHLSAGDDSDGEGEWPSVS